MSALTECDECPNGKCSDCPRLTPRWYPGGTPPTPKVARWSGIVQSAEHGGFVAYGDYIKLERDNARLREELAESTKSAQFSHEVCVAQKHRAELAEQQLAEARKELAVANQNVQFEEGYASTLEESNKSLRYQLAEARKGLPCGHHVSLLVKSVESDYQFCDLCECRKMRNDAQMMERELRDDLAESRNKFSQMRDWYEALLKELTDPIVRAKMLEPSPPIILDQNAELAALRAKLAEAEKKVECTMSVGDGSGQLFVHGTYESIKAAQALVLRVEGQAARIASLEHLLSEREAERVLFSTDAYCPNCGHNRDKSSVSSIDNEDGTNSCQICGIRWAEFAKLKGER